MHNSKKIVCFFFILQLLLTYSIGYSQQVSNPVTYYADIKPFGDGIDWESYIPADFEPIRAHLKFLLSPGTVEAEFAGNIILNKIERTLRVVPRSVFDDEKDDSDTLFSGRFKSTGGLILESNFVFDFEMPIPFFDDVHINHAVPIPGLPQINAGWDEENFFNSFLLSENESVQLNAGVREILSAEFTVVEIAGAVSVSLLSGGAALHIVEIAEDIVREHLADAGISFNAGLINRLTLSGDGIYFNDLLTRGEGETVPAPALNPALDSYSIFSSYDEDFTVALDMLLSSDIFVSFSPLGIELWSYDKTIAEYPVPIIPEKKLDALVFTTSPDPITFSLKPDDAAALNRAPVPTGSIFPQTVHINDTFTPIDISSKFSDPDNDILIYSSTSSDSAVATAQIVGPKMTIHPSSAGSTIITITATDPEGLTATQSFSVFVNPSGVDTSDSSDLVVENISADYVDNYPGERYTVSATVRNAGGRRAPNVRVRYYHSSDATYSTDDEEYEGRDDSLGSMESGETRRVDVKLNAPDEQGTYYIIARVARVRNEQNTNNNYEAIKITVLPPATPDLVVTLTARHKNITTLTATSYLIDSNDYFKLIADVRNQGKEDAPDDTTVRYYFSTDPTISSDDEEFDTDRIWHRQLDAGDLMDESTGLHAPEKPGDYYYYAYVDSVEGEVNTDNNYSDVIKVSVRGPDLVIASVSVDYLASKRPAVFPNGKVELHVTVRNQGTDDSHSTKLRYYVSSDAAFSEDDTQVSEEYLGGFDANESRVQKPVPIYVPYPSRFFYCFVCIVDVKDEVDTDNNCSAPIRVNVRNVSPVAKGTIADQTLNVGIPMSIDVSQYFSDENNDRLTYNASSSNTTVVSVNAPNNVVIITPKRTGSATITVTASDGEQSDTQTISVTVNDAVRVDINGDGIVNIQDLVIVANNFGKNEPDINGDGIVNIQDLVIVVHNFGK